MNKAEYIDRFKRELSGLPHNIQNEILAEQEDHFSAALADGRNAEEIAHSMGDPEQNAKAYRAHLKIEGASRATTMSDKGRQITQALFALIVLTPLNFIFVLGPVIALLGILIGFVGAGFGILGVGSYALFRIPFLPEVDFAFSLAGLFAGLGLIALALSWLAVAVMAIKSSAELLLRYFKFNLFLITGTKKA